MEQKTTSALTGKKDTETKNNEAMKELLKTLSEKLTSKEAGIIGVIGVGVAGVYMMVREGIKVLSQA